MLSKSPPRSAKNRMRPFLGADAASERQRRILDDAEPQQLALLDGVRVRARLLQSTWSERYVPSSISHLPPSWRIEALAVEELRLLQVVLGGLGERASRPCSAARAAHARPRDPCRSALPALSPSIPP
jgi:hypothetical protein